MQKAANDWKFHKTLAPKLDQAERNWHAQQPPNIPPPIKEDLRITAPWATDDEPNSTE